MQDITKNIGKYAHSLLSDPAVLKKSWDQWVLLVEKGDKEALRFVLNRLMPGTKTGSNISFELPIVNDINDLSEAEKRVTDSLNNKEITISDAKDLFQILETKQKTIMMRDILTTLESRDEILGR